MILHSTKVYLVHAVGRWEGLVSFDLRFSNDPSGSETIAPNILSPLDISDSYSHRAYLVKSIEGELWMVRRFLRYQLEDGSAWNGGTKKFRSI